MSFSNNRIVSNVLFSILSQTQIYLMKPMLIHVPLSVTWLLVDRKIMVGAKPLSEPMMEHTQAVLEALQINSKKAIHTVVVSNKDMVV